VSSFSHLVQNRVANCSSSCLHSTHLGSQYKQAGPLPIGGVRERTDLGLSHFSTHYPSIMSSAKIFTIPSTVTVGQNKLQACPVTHFVHLPAPVQVAQFATPHEVHPAVSTKKPSLHLMSQCFVKSPVAPGTKISV